MASFQRWPKTPTTFTARGTTFATYPAGDRENGCCPWPASWCRWGRLARLRALSAGRTRPRLEPAEAPEAMAAQAAADGRDRQVEAAERAS